MRRSTILMGALSMLIVAAAAGADMGKTAPALKASGGSKAGPAITEGIEHYNQGHWDVAEKHFREAVQADPKSAEAHYNLALALDKLDEHETAIEHFKKAKELGKDNPDIQQSAILQGHLKAKH